MLYRVFNNAAEVATANDNWMQARAQAGEHDKKLGVEIHPEITSAWDVGREMLDGRIACMIPTQWGNEFGGLALELTADDFPVPEESEVS